MVVSRFITSAVCELLLALPVSFPPAYCVFFSFFFSFCLLCEQSCTYLPWVKLNLGGPEELSIPS